MVVGEYRTEECIGENYGANSFPRPLWLVGSALLGVSLMVMGGLGTPQPTSYSLSQGIVAMMLIFQMAYVATLGPLYYTLISEIPASRLRDKSVRVGGITNVVTMCVTPPSWVASSSLTGLPVSLYPLLCLTSLILLEPTWEAKWASYTVLFAPSIPTC